MEQTIQDRFNIVNTRGNYPLHGNQSSLLEKLKKVFKNKYLKEELALIKDIIRKNKPNYTEKEILELAAEISKSGCTYVAAAANIMEQINYDEERFYQMFKFPMRNSRGELNHDALIAELYSFMKDKAEFNITGRFDVLNYENIFEAAKQLTNQEFTNSDDAFMAVVDHGYHIDGTEYSKFVSEPELMIDDYHGVAKKLFGTDVNSVQEFKEKCKENKITVQMQDFENAYKFSGLHATTFDKWMNYYFKEKNIDLEFISENLYFDSYEHLISGLKERMESGFSIVVGSKQNLSMTDGSKLGWFNFESIGPIGGHAMPFVGVSSEGDIILTSWSQMQLVPKEFYDRLLFTSRKLNVRKKQKENTSVIKKTGNDIYDSINKKIAYIVELLQTINESSQIDALIKLQYRQLFTLEEKEIISLEQLKEQIMNNYNPNLGDESFGR